jgi:PKD repeat protein
MRTPRALVMLLVLTGVLALAPDAARAQFENHTWYFGEGLGLDFSTAPPTVLRDGRTSSYEGSASVSDPNTGKILFYTDGVTVWNSVHEPMPNGFNLAGHLSSTQPAVIVPDPGNGARYYIFTADQSGYSGDPKGINYSVVDLRREGGRGDVVEKNTPLLGQASEKITAIKICNGSAYWVIAHQFFSDRFFVWKVDASGISPPVVSDVGSIHGPGTGDGIGWISASPDGTKLALAFFERSQQEGNLELFRFDPETGLISRPLLLRRPMKPYGVAFSPSGNKVYVSSVGRIEQFDVSNWDLASIQNSWESLPSISTENGAIKLGPDGKLYVQHSTYMGVVSAPELPGVRCNYVENALPMNSRIQWGLPNNIDAHSLGVCGPPEARIKSFISPICEAECVSFFDSSRFGPTSWKWEFEGAVPSTSTFRNPTNICYPTAGRYKVQLTATNAAGSSIDIKFINVQKCLPPQVSLRDTTICATKCITFVDTSTSSDYTRIWEFPGGTPSTFTGKAPPPVCFDTPGTYTVKLIASNEWGRDTAISLVTVNDCPGPVARSEYDTVVCIGSPVVFSDRSSNDPTDWEWSFDGGTPASAVTKDAGPIVYDAAGVYEVRQIVRNANGADTAYTQIRVTPCDPPTAKLTDRDLCQGDCIDLVDQSTNAPTSWLWTLSGPMQQTFMVKDPGQLCFSTAGTYELKLVVTNEYGSDSATSAIIVRSSYGWTAPTFDITNAIALCAVLDTFIMVYSGCAPIEITNFASSDLAVFSPNIPTSLNAYDSVRIPIRIAPSSVGAMTATLSMMLGPKQHDVTVSFSGGADAERFVFGALDSNFTALACEAVARAMTITNDACAEHLISFIGIEPPGNGFTLILDDLNLVIPGKGALDFQIQYDASIAENVEAELVIRTAGGVERRFRLVGSRLLPASGMLRLRATGPTAILPNEPISAQLAFDQAIDAQLVPEVIELTFGYNTDVISASHITAKDGWAIVSKTEGAAGLDLRLARTRSAIAANAELVEIEFKSFIASESTTGLSLDRVVCDPDDPDFELCVYDLQSIDSSRVAILPICGTTELSSKLGDVKAVQLTVHPHPVLSNDDLRFTLSTGLPSLIGHPIAVSLVDLAGRRTELLTSSLSALRQEMRVPLQGLSSGVYVLSVKIGEDLVTTTVVIQ